MPALRELGFGVPVMPDGAFYVYADCSRFLSDALPDSDALAQVLLDDAGVALVPGKDFGHHGTDRWMRVSYATSMENLREAIARIGRALATERRTRTRAGGGPVYSAATRPAAASTFGSDGSTVSML